MLLVVTDAKSNVWKQYTLEVSIDDGLQSVELGEYSSTRETGLPRHTVTSGKQPYLQILSTDLIDIYTEVQGKIFSDDKFN